MSTLLDGLPQELRRAAAAIARRLADAGHGAWIVGGAVRDLVLGRPPKDVDLATPATPEEIEALFEGTLGVGRAFGTLIVRWEGVSVEVTTFRSEAGYSDGRRPDRVEYGTSLEEDARRRDFTCNALYLDPLTGDVLDPVGGRRDLERSLLRAVGVAEERFLEDGLRLLRLVRFAATYSLTIDPETWNAARLRRDSLRPISVERVLSELGRMLSGTGRARAHELLESAGFAALLFPARPTPWRAGWSADEGRAVRQRAFEALAPEAGEAEALALFFDAGDEGDVEASSRAMESFEGLRPSRRLRQGVERAWLGLALLRRLGRGLAAHPRAAGLRLLASEAWPRVESLAAAWRAAGDPRLDALDDLRALAAEVPPEARAPAPWLEAADLARAGAPRGPLWGRLLEEAYDRQLEGLLGSRERALAWLGERLSSEEPPGAGSS